VIALPEAPPPILADSVTRLGPNAVGAVVVTGSHGGVYAAYLARQAGCRAAIFNDAAIGRDDAGVGGLPWLDGHEMAAAAIDYRSADIGNADMTLRHGIVSRVNARASSLGLHRGMLCADAARMLATAEIPQGQVEPVAESRRVLTPEGAKRRLVLIDSAALVREEDAGQVVVTGSHGALFGGDPTNALKVDAAVAVFNDAGGGVGTTRLPALQKRGIAAVTVAAGSARIGDAFSTWHDGVISDCNAAAKAMGAKAGMNARDFVRLALGD
jgi:uncharacterized protein YunC (DUF1805 family)